MIRLVRDQSLAAFLEESRPHLFAHPTAHSMMLSLADRYLKKDKPVSVLARGLDAKGQVRVAGLQTEPYRPINVSFAIPEDAAAFARALQGKKIPGVIGPIEAAEAFAAAWCEGGAHAPKLLKNLRLFGLTQVIEPRPAPGTFREPRAEDEDLIFTWLRAFAREAVPHDPVLSDEEVRADLQAGLAAGHFFLWEDAGVPVCLVGSRRETERERWIAPVYTPPELRGNGYASCLVAEVSRRILQRGKTPVLFTDLENPTSNSIYQKIGYRPVTDFRNYEFV